MAYKISLFVLQLLDESKTLLILNRLQRVTLILKVRMLYQRRVTHPSKTKTCHAEKVRLWQMFEKKFCLKKIGNSKGIDKRRDLGKDFSIWHILRSANLKFIVCFFPYSISWTSYILSSR